MIAPSLRSLADDLYAARRQRAIEEAVKRIVENGGYWNLRGFANASENGFCSCMICRQIVAKVREEFRHLMAAA